MTLSDEGFLELAPLRLEYRMIGLRPNEAPTIVMLHEGLGSVGLWGAFPEHLAAATYMDGSGKAGYRRQLAPRGPYRTADGYIAALPYSRKNWTRFFEAVGRPDLADDPRVTDDAQRSHAIAELYAILAEILPARTTEGWLALFHSLDIPAARMNTLDGRG